MSEMIETVDTNSLVPAARNARTHSEEQIAQLVLSIKEFGWTNPILIDENNIVIAGHGRLEAANKLGLKQVPTIRLEGLSDPKKRALALADNKLALNAGWDETMLLMELSDLKEFDLTSLTGFSDADFEALERNEIDPIGPPPLSVEENAAHLAEIKAQRSKGNAGMVSKTDTERYLVIVFPSRDHRERAAMKLGLPEDERYIVSDAVELRPRFNTPKPYEADRKAKAAPNNKSGSGG